MKKTIRVSLKLIAFLLLTISFISGVNADQTVENQYKNIAAGKPNYTLAKDTGDVAAQFTDGIHAKGHFWKQMSTVGWKGEWPVNIIDLRKTELVCGMFYNAATDTAGNTWTKFIGILLSDDGKSDYSVWNFFVMNKKAEVSSASGYGVFRYWIDRLETYDRYVRLVIYTVGSYAFSDAVKVYRGEFQWLNHRLFGEPVKDKTEYFSNKVINDMIVSRLALDVRNARQMVITSDLDEKRKLLLLTKITNVEKEISLLPPATADSFRAILPINDLEAKLFSIYGEVRKLQGSPMLETWVSNPYDCLTPTQGPDKTAKNQVDVFMMRGEWRYATVNITNSSDKAITTHFKINGLPGGVNPDFITVDQVEWTDTKEQKAIDSALVAAQHDDDGYRITIPAGMVRQVWLSFHPVNMSAGSYSGQITITRSGNHSLIIPLTLKVFPMDFPQNPTLHLGGWDYTGKTTGDVSFLSTFYSY